MAKEAERELKTAVVPQRIAILLLFTALLAGCGVKGDPELPPERTDAQGTNEKDNGWWKIF